tara:strand:+ start:1364 stop:2287 length:924 start_codon:yes stop_codon:yes gene_type:complete
MRTLLFISLTLITLNIFSQKKIKFNKDIYPLIESKSFIKVKPVLREFLKNNPNNLKANYWLGVIYYGNTVYHTNDIQNNNAEIKPKYYDFIDSSKYYLIKTKSLANIATLNPLSARFFPDFNGVSSEELVVDAQSKIDRWIKLLNTTKSNWDAEQLRRNELLILQQPYLSIDCEYEDEDDYMLTNCRWGKYNILSRYDRDENVRYMDLYTNNNTILFSEMFVSKDKASSFFEEKFKEVYNQLKSEDPSCFEEAEFFFDLSLIYIVDGNQDGLIFGLHNRGVMNNCRGMYGESTFLVPFEDIIPLIKL